MIAISGLIAGVLLGLLVGWVPELPSLNRRLDRWARASAEQHLEFESSQTQQIYSPDEGEIEASLEPPVVLTDSHEESMIASGHS